MQPSTSSAPRIASASAPADNPLELGLGLCATITVVELLVEAGVVVVGTVEVAVLAVCVAAPVGVVVGGATLPGWAAPVGAEVLVVAEAGVVLVGTGVVEGTVVVAMWTLADAGILMPRSLPVVVPAAWAPAGVSAVSAHAAAAIDAVRVWRKLRLGLAVIAFAMLTAALLLGAGPACRLRREPRRTRLPCTLTRGRARLVGWHEHRRA
jgi:hypothetical protein